MINYISNRKQCVVCNDTIYRFSNVHTGAPQGSNKDPLLFFIHINDLAIFTKEIHIICVDDTSMYRIKKNFTSFKSDINNIFDALNGLN